MENSKLMGITREACAMIHEQLPENRYIVSIFQEQSNATLGQSFQGRMDNQSLIALANAAINELAEQTGMTREDIFDELKRRGDPVASVTNFRR